MPDDQPVTRIEMIALLSDFKQELKQELRQELKHDRAQELRDIKEEIFEKIDAAELRGREHTERIEIRLLTAFHNWATPVNHRLRKLENADSGVLERLASVEERLTTLELRP